MSDTLLGGSLVLLSLAFVISLGFIFWSQRRFHQEVSGLKKTLESSKKIYQLILSDLDFDTVVQRIANTIPNELQFGTGVVSVLDENRRVIRRIAASQTPEAQAAIQTIQNSLKVPFSQIEIPLDDPRNLMSRAIRERKPFITSSSFDVFCPVFTEQESKIVQETMGTKTTLVYPIFMKDKPLGVFIASTKKEQSKLTSNELYIINDFVNIVGMVMQNSQLYTSLKVAKNDLTRVNAEVSRINQQLQQIDKLKDDFVSIASHELRTPMTAIRSYVWMAINRSDIPLSPKLKKYLDRTLLSTERLINLVNDMLNISRIESGRIEIKPNAFSLETLINDVLYEVGAKAKEKKVAVTAQKVMIPPVFADADKVHQVLLNLIGNALKFTPAGGKITISFVSDGHLIETMVADTGVGIAREDISKLFSKFGRLDSSYVAAATSGGTGLGLYICKNLIELMGGKIRVYSDGLGRGAVFSFSLPIASPDVIAKSKKYEYTPAGGARGLEPVAI